MKKILATLVLVALVLTMFASVASAVAPNNPFGSKVIYCAANAEQPLNNAQEPSKSVNNHRIYVRHYFYGDWGGVYTNYFRAGGTQTNATSLLGGSWMAPDTANFVTSNSITTGRGWYAVGRGNTNYGLNSIQITGYSNEDA
jgi:hypothetical protein